MSTPTGPIDPARAAQQTPSTPNATYLAQVESDEDMSTDVDTEFTNPFARRFFRPLDERTEQLVEEPSVESAEEKEDALLTTSQIEQAAARVHARYEVVQARSLIILRNRLTDRDTPDDVLHKLREAFPDFSLADEALQFLLDTATPGTREAIRDAQTQFRSVYDREIRAGQNIQVQARAFSKEGLGSPTSLRDLYRDLVLNPREPLKMFDELTKLFSYGKMNTAIRFLLHSLGDDLKSKGPTISRGELSRLLDDARSLQGILGVYRFFQSRMRMIRMQLEMTDPEARMKLTFEDLAKGFIRLLSERYVAPDKVLQLGRQLGLADQTVLQVLVYTQMFEALKQTFGGYYRNPQHREELRQALLKTLEQLEKQLEDEQEKEEEKDE